MWYFYFTNDGRAGLIFREVQFSPENYNFIIIQYLYVGGGLCKEPSPCISVRELRPHSSLLARVSTIVTVTSFRPDKINVRIHYFMCVYISTTFRDSLHHHHHRHYYYHHRHYYYYYYYVWKNTSRCTALYLIETMTRAWYSYSATKNLGWMQLASIPWNVMRIAGQLSGI